MYILYSLLITICLLLSGCFSHPYVGGHAYYPQTSDYKSALYRLSITIHGASGKAYADHTRKKIFLTLKKNNGEALLDREYTIKGGNVKWSVRWENEDAIEIVFYEFEKKYAYSGHGEPKPDARQIFSVSIKSGLSKENDVIGDVPEWVSSQLFNVTNRDSKRQIIELRFPLRVDKIESILTTVQNIAKELDLHEKDIPPGLIGRLVEYSIHNLHLTVHRFDSLGEIEVIIQDWGRRELSKRIE